MSGLEVISGTTAVSQLLSQAITIIQKIQDARGRVHGASARLDAYKGQLDNLLSTLGLIQDVPELQSPAIQEQIQTIVSLGKEVQGQLDVLAARLAKSKAKQYTHTFIRGDREEKDLENAMTRLDRAKVDLTARIVAIHVGLSGTMYTGFTASLAIIQRVDQNVQKVLGERLCLATLLEKRSFDEDSNGTVPLTEEDVRALNLVDRVSWVENKAFNDAVMVNADLVERPTSTPKERSYIRNEAHHTSFVLQGNVDADTLATILRARRGQ